MLRRQFKITIIFCKKYKKQCSRFDSLMGFFSSCAPGRSYIELLKRKFDFAVKTYMFRYESYIFCNKKIELVFFCKHTHLQTTQLQDRAAGRKKVHYREKKILLHEGMNRPLCQIILIKCSSGSRYLFPLVNWVLSEVGGTYCLHQRHILRDRRPGATACPASFLGNLDK
jgi:hypothetical protein